MTVIDGGDPWEEFDQYPSLGNIYEPRDALAPLEKRHHPECRAPLSVENRCKCRELYDRDYPKGETQ